MHATYVKVWPCVVLLLGMGVATSCHQSPSSEQGDADSEEILAMVGRQPITRAAFEKEWNARLARGSSLVPGKRARSQLLDTMIEEAAWTARAKAEGFDRRPDIQARIDRFLAGEYREAELSKRMESVSAPDETIIAEYYEAHPSEFTIAASIRAGVILIRTRLEASEDKRRETRLRAEGVRQAALEASDASYAQLVQRHSEDLASRYTGGDTGWLEQRESATRWAPEVVHAAFELTRPGDVAPLVESEAGFHIVRLSARREARLRPLDDVRESIAYRLERERHAAIEQALLEDVRNGLEININQALLDSIELSGTVRTAALPAVPGR